MQAGNETWKMENVTISAMKTSNPSAALSVSIRQHLAAMPPAEKKLADLMLEYPGHLASHSASEITHMVGVSNAAMTRFVKRLGYDNYDHMRRLARDGINWGSPLFLLNPDRAASTSAPFAEHVDASISNIEQTFRAISCNDIEQIVQCLATAPKVGLFGQRNNYFFAGYLRWQLIQFRSGVHLLPMAGETLAEHLAGYSANDMVILFGLRRRSALTEKLIAIIHQQGARTLLITDAGNQQNLGASWVLRCNSQSCVPLDNHVAVMALCHVLSAKLIESTGSSGRKHLARIEELHEVLSEM